MARIYYKKVNLFVIKVMINCNPKQIIIAFIIFCSKFKKQISKSLGIEQIFTKES